MGRAPWRNDCSSGQRLHNFPRAEEQLFTQLCNSVLFSGGPDAEPAPGPKIQLHWAGLCKAPCAVTCPTAASGRWEAAVSWDAAQATAEVLPCLKQGCTVWLILGTAQALLRGEAQRRGSHRSRTGDGCHGGRRPTGALGLRDQPSQPPSLKLRW